MSAQAVTLDELRRHPSVAHARPWKGRINIDVRGTLSCQGEQNSRVWLTADRLTIALAGGATSLLWESNLAALRTWLTSRGVIADVRR